MNSSFPLPAVYLVLLSQAVAAITPTTAPTFTPNNFGFIFVSGDDTDHHVALQAKGGILDDAMETIIQTCIQSSGISNTSTTKDILALGIQHYGSQNNECNTWPGNKTDAWIAFNRWISVVGQRLGRPITHDIITDATKVATVNFADYRMLYLPSQKAVAQCSNNFDYTLCAIETALTQRKYDIQVYVNALRGSIFALEQTVDPYVFII